MELSLNHSQQIVKIRYHERIFNTNLTIGPFEPCYTGPMYRNRPSRAEMKHLSPDQLRAMLVTCRAEVAQFYDLFAHAPNGATRAAAKKGYKAAYIQGSAYIDALRKRGCTVPAMERPKEPEQIQLIEEVKI